MARFALAEEFILTPTYTSTPGSTRGIQAITQDMAQGPLGGAVLVNHPAQSATTVDGWRSIFFGLPFALIGLFIEAVALGVIANHGKHAPNWVIGVVGSFFFLGGAALISHGVRGVVRKAEYRRELEQHSGQVWYADYHWHPKGFRFSAFKTMMGRLLAAMAWSGFLVPFFWVGLKASVIFLVFASIFALLGLVFWFRWAQMLAELVRYGNSFLHYEQFPFYLGSRLNARLTVPAHVSDLDQLTLTLRCVVERYITSGSGNSRTNSVVCYELYKSQTTLSHEQLGGFAGGDIPVSFTVPADQPTTTLIATPPTYWEIEARGTSAKVNYEAYFLVPVYKTP